MENAAADDFSRASHVLDTIFQILGHPSKYGMVIQANSSKSTVHSSAFVLFLVALQGIALPTIYYVSDEASGRLSLRKLRTHQSLSHTDFEHVLSRVWKGEILEHQLRNSNITSL